MKPISTEQALALIEEQCPELAPSLAENLNNGHLEALVDDQGTVNFRITEEGKRYVEQMGTSAGGVS